MMNLIITLISIALISAVAVSALYNGGQAFDDGKLKSEVNQVLNAKEQITSAIKLYELEENQKIISTIYYKGDDVIKKLTPKYLIEEPKLPKGVEINRFHNNTYYNELEIGLDRYNEDLCIALKNKRDDVEDSDCPKSKSTGPTYGVKYKF